MDLVTAIYFHQRHQPSKQYNVLPSLCNPQGVVLQASQIVTCGDCSTPQVSLVAMVVQSIAQTTVTYLASLALMVGVEKALHLKVLDIWGSK
jgi:hypothetical protein